MRDADIRQIGAVVSRLSEAEFEALVRLVSSMVYEMIAGPSSTGQAAPVSSGSVRGGGSPHGHARGGGSPRAAAHGAVHVVDAPVLVEDDVRAARSRGCSSISVSPSAVLSPLALDAARDWGIRIDNDGREG